MSRVLIEVLLVHGRDSPTVSHAHATAHSPRRGQLPYTWEYQPSACIKPVRGRLPNHERPELVTSAGRSAILARF